MREFIEKSPTEEEVRVYSKGYEHSMVDGENWSSFHAKESDVLGCCARQFEGFVTGGAGEVAIYEMWKKHDAALMEYAIEGLESLDIYDE